MLCLHSLADVTLGDIQGNFTLHTVLPEQVLQVFIHLSPSGVDGVRCIVSFLQDSELQLLYIGHTQSSIEPKNSFIIYRELRGLPEGHLLLDSLDTIVSLLCLLDLIKQSRNQLEVSKKTGRHKLQTQLLELLVQSWLCLS